MAKTILHRTTIGVVSIIFVVAVLLGVLKGEVISQPDVRKANDGQQEHESLNAQTINQGASLFKNKGCASCHAVDSAKAGIGPSLKGLFKGIKNLGSGAKVTDKSVRDQIKTPYKNMPPFADRLNEDELDQIIVYLKTLRS
jgi:cytochrome c oxidase subunit II